MENYCILYAMNAIRASSTTHRGAWLVLSLATLLLLFSVRPDARAAAQAAYADDISFAKGLLEIGFADFAEQVIDRIVHAHPDAVSSVAPLRIDLLAAHGRFEEAHAIIEDMPPDATKTLSLRLALGDAYYARNRIDEAREIYESFFARFPEGPPAQLSVLYRDSAYRFAQMMLHAGQAQDALQAFDYILQTDPEREIKRRIQTEMAEVMLALGERASGDEREDYFERTRRLCREIQWGGQDLWFGKTVVMLSHIEVVNDNPERAREIIREYLPMLRRIDQALREENAPMRFSPMAECRYQLGKLHERAAESHLAAEEPENAMEEYAAALRHFHNVFIQYPGSAWAIQSGNKARRIARILESMGRTVRIPPYDLEPVINAQLREARLLLDANDFENAEIAYRAIVNTFPEHEHAVLALADLTRCYIEMDHPFFAKAVTGYLAERYPSNTTLSERAGVALLRIADVYETAGRSDDMHEVYDLFVRYYPDHPRVPNLFMRLGEMALREERYAEALSRFQHVVDTFPQSRAALDALSRVAHTHMMQTQFADAADILRKYMDELSPGPELIEARRRLADAYRSDGRYADAIREYEALIRILENEDEDARHIRASTDVSRNRQVYQQALFRLAHSYSRCNEPANEIQQFRRAAVETYRRYLEEFPDSESAPAALSMTGALFLMLDRSHDAAQAYDRLARDYPDSPQARDALFAQGSSLIAMGQSERALKVFEEMFTNPDAFTGPQFLRVAGLMHEEQQYDSAIRALTVAMTTDQRSVWERAAIKKAVILMEQNRFADAVATIKELFQRYPQSAHSVEAGFLLSNAYARMASDMRDTQQRVETLQQSISALRRVRRITETPADRARADYELAGIQMLMDQRQEALASYLRLFLLSDINTPGIRPLLEKAYEQAVPLLFEYGQYDEIIDTSRVYLDLFPNGRLAGAARRWRSEAIEAAARSDDSGP